MKIKRFLAIVVALLLTSSVAESACPGGVCRPPQQWRASPQARRPIVRPLLAVVRVGYRIGNVTSWGSGTIIDRRNGRAFILTCWHIFRDGRGQAIVRLHDGRLCLANVLKIDRQNDLAVLEIVDPGIEPLVVAGAAPAVGERLSAAGYGRGAFGAVQGQARGYVRAKGQAGAESLEMTGAARDGDSGGPMLNSRGEVVAVLWGTDNRRIIGTYCPRIRLFLKRLLRRPVVPVVVVKPSAPVANEPSAKPPCSELTKLQARISELEKRIAGLKPVPGPPGPIGPRGLMGPVGPAGPTGKDAVCDVSTLPPIIVQTIKDGEVIETEEVFLGGVLSFRLIPVGGSNAHNSRSR